MQTKAKIFRNGRSQAVRLPKEFRFDGNEVKITKAGDKVILEPIDNSEWPDGFWEKFTKDYDFTVPAPLPGKDFNLE